MPFTSLNQGTGDVEGADIDVCNAIASDLGLAPRIEVAAFPALLPGLTARRFDLVCSGVHWTAERAASPDLSLADPYILDGVGMVVRSDSPISNWDDITDGMKMGGLEGGAEPTAAQAFLNEQGVEIEWIAHPGNAETLLDLKNGRVDFAILALLVANFHSGNDPEVTAVGDPIRPLTVHTAVRKEATNLLAAANDTIAAMLADGRLETIHETWFNGRFPPVSGPIECCD